MYEWFLLLLQSMHLPMSLDLAVVPRAFFAFLTAMLLMLMGTPAFIRKLQKFQLGQVVRDDGPKSHYSKAGTPTMGGILILVAVLAATLLWSDWSSLKVWLVVGTTGLFGVIGWLDDYLKISKKNTKGLPGKMKLLGQGLGALVVAWLLYHNAQSGEALNLFIPFMKHAVVPLGVLFIPFVMCVIVGSSNAVNLTDGLDGLAIVPTILVAAAFMLLIFCAQSYHLANHFQIPFVADSAELLIFCASLIGAGLGFLWFNAYPAQVFMGDVGALALGGALGVVAVCIQQELLLFFMGGIFVLETVSVILQVGSYKMRRKRIFRMAPIHHHFELVGWPETRVIVRFWIISVLLVVCGLATLLLG